jgi:hypothetical protein
MSPMGAVMINASLEAAPSRLFAYHLTGYNTLRVAGTGCCSTDCTNASIAPVPC